MNFSLAGTTIVTNNGVTILQSSDSCSGNILTEYSCLTPTSANINNQTTTCSNGCSSGACNPPVVVNAPFVNASYLGQLADKTAPWSWSPGWGNDFTFNLSFNSLSAFNVSSMHLTHNIAGEYWDTITPGSFPIVLFTGSGTQINFNYVSPVVNVPAGLQNYNFYAQPGTPPFAGGQLAIYLTNGTNVTINV